MSIAAIIVLGLGAFVLGVAAGYIIAAFAPAERP
jgi:hypothetical protein